MVQKTLSHAVGTNKSTGLQYAVICLVPIWYNGKQVIEYRTVSKFPHPWKTFEMPLLHQYNWQREGQPLLSKDINYLVKFILDKNTHSIE